jgi:BA14K-like protein
MKRAILTIAAAATIAVGTMSAPSTANARCYGCAVGAGIVAGAIIGGAIANSRPRYYYPPPPVAYYPPPGDAVAYCMQRFKSYDPRSGTYLGYDGYRHPCP